MPIHPKRWEDPEKPLGPMPVPCEPGDARPYRLGKFDLILDSLIYTISLEGMLDEDVGSSDELGWYGLIRSEDKDDAIDLLKLVNKHAIEQQEAPLTMEECETILRARVIILREGESGFVSVSYYNSKVKGERKWKQIEKDYEEFDEERERQERGEDE